MGMTKAKAVEHMKKLQNSDWIIYHYNLHKLKTKADIERYVRFYNRYLDMYISGENIWPSMIDVNGSDDIKREDENALGCAVTDATQDIREVAILTHPQHRDYILSGGGERASTALRIWKEDSAENGWPEILEELRLSIG